MRCSSGALYDKNEYSTIQIGEFSIPTNLDTNLFGRKYKFQLCLYILSISWMDYTILRNRKHSMMWWESRLL